MKMKAVPWRLLRGNTQDRRRFRPDQATSISGAGSLNIQEGSALSLTGKAGLSGTSVTLNGTLGLSGTGEKSIQSLSGSGTLALNGGTLSVTSASARNGSFSGTLDGEDVLTYPAA